MGLYQRWTATGENATNKINVHAFGAALREFARGQITKAQIVAAFDLDAQDETQLDAIIATYQALPNAAAQAKGMQAFESAMILAEAGYYTEQQCKDSLGF